MCSCHQQQLDQSWALFIITRWCEMLWWGSVDEDHLQLSSSSKKQLFTQCQLRITQNNRDETVEIDDNTPEVDSNDWKHSEGENKKQHALR